MPFNMENIIRKLILHAAKNAAFFPSLLIFRMQNKLCGFIFHAPILRMEFSLQANFLSYFKYGLCETYYLKTLGL